MRFDLASKRAVEVQIINIDSSSKHLTYLVSKANTPFPDKWSGTLSSISKPRSSFCCFCRRYPVNTKKSIGIFEISRSGNSIYSDSLRCDLTLIY